MQVSFPGSWHALPLLWNICHLDTMKPAYLSLRRLDFKLTLSMICKGDVRVAISSTMLSTFLAWPSTLLDGAASSVAALHTFIPQSASSKDKMMKSLVHYKKDFSASQKTRSAISGLNLDRALYSPQRMPFDARRLFASVTRAMS